jgi:hypothetical protein
LIPRRCRITTDKRLSVPHGLPAPGLDAHARGRRVTPSHRAAPARRRGTRDSAYCLKARTCRLSANSSSPAGRAIRTACYPKKPPTDHPPMPLPRRRPKPDRRRALELLASCRDGCKEAIMLAHELVDRHDGRADERRARECDGRARRCRAARRSRSRERGSPRRDGGHSRRARHDPKG